MVGACPNHARLVCADGKYRIASSTVYTPEPGDPVWSSVYCEYADHYAGGKVTYTLVPTLDPQPVARRHRLITP